MVQYTARRLNDAEFPLSALPVPGSPVLESVPPTLVRRPVGMWAVTVSRCGCPSTTLFVMITDSLTSSWAQRWGV